MLKQDSWSAELVVGQSPDGKNVSTDIKDIVEIRNQATAGEYIMQRIRSTNCRVCKIAIAL
jgi:hypothetical protein